jgi:hypothetical protein
MGKTITKNPAARCLDPLQQIGPRAGSARAVNVYNNDTPEI